MGISVGILVDISVGTLVGNCAVGVIVGVVAGADVEICIPQQVALFMPTLTQPTSHCSQE